jgi:hypothetical protein
MNRRFGQPAKFDVVGIFALALLVRTLVLLSKRFAFRLGPDAA